MIRKLSFGIFDTGETILGALVFSTFFPLYITKHIDTKVYSLLYALSFALSFLLALYIGSLADRKALRKHFFIAFSFLVAVLCSLIYVSYGNPSLSLAVFLLLAITHQQSLVFYNSMLLNFESRGFASGFGVALGYIGSAVALLFMAQSLKEPEVYALVGMLFLLFSMPSIFTLPNPPHMSEVRVSHIFRDKRFILIVFSILCLTEVANTLIAMMGIYLREVFTMERADIYRVIGTSAIGGVVGGLFWGYVTDRIGVERVFRLGFVLWAIFLLTLPIASERTVLLWGLMAGVLLSHVWTTSRLLVLSRFPEEESSVRLSFLSLSERVASISGLLTWSFLLFITGDNFVMSAMIMTVFPVAGWFLYNISHAHSGSPN